MAAFAASRPTILLPMARHDQLDGCVCAKAVFGSVEAARASIAHQRSRIGIGSDFAAVIASEARKYARVIEAAGVKAPSRTPRPGPPP